MPLTMGGDTLRGASRLMPIISCACSVACGQRNGPIMAKRRTRADRGQMNILFALPGLHRWDRGAEVAFIAVADALANAGEQVTLIGSGPAREATAYRYVRAASLDRSYFNRFPSLPFVRNDYAYEELTFAPSLLLHDIAHRRST